MCHNTTIPLVGMETQAFFGIFLFLRISHNTTIPLVGMETSQVQSGCDTPSTSQYNNPARRDGNPHIRPFCDTALYVTIQQSRSSGWKLSVANSPYCSGVIVTIQQSRSSGWKPPHRAFRSQTSSTGHNTTIPLVGMETQARE